MTRLPFDGLFPIDAPEHLVWDGSRPEGERLYLESGTEYRKYTGIVHESELFGIKAGSKIVYHRTPKDMKYAINCITDDITEVVKKYGKKVIFFHSGACPTGRKIRRRNLDKINEKYYIREKQKDFLLGQTELFGMIKGAFEAHGIKKVAQHLVTHDDFRDDKRRKRISYLWADMLEDGYIICVNENDASSYTEIEQEILLMNGDMVSLDEISPKEMREMEGEIRKMKVFSDNDGLQREGCTVMSELGIPTLAINMTAERGIRPLDYYTGGPLKEYKVISLVKDSTGLESQIVLKEEERTRGGGISKINNSAGAIKDGVKGVIVCQGGYTRFDWDYWKNGLEGRELMPLRAIMLERFIGTRFVGKEFEEAA